MMKFALLTLIFLTPAALMAHEPSIPVYGRGPVIGHYRPALLPAPTLFPGVFRRYRRAWVYEPASHHPHQPAQHHTSAASAALWNTEAIERPAEPQRPLTYETAR